MTFPERFSNLPEYAFPRLRALLGGITPAAEVLDMTIGEPKHPMPAFVAELIAKHADEFAKYPPNDGAPELRAAIAGWITRRYGVDLDPATNIVPLNGTREGLFNTLVALCPETKAGQKPYVLVPNPFYQVYAVAALAVAAEPYYVSALPENAFLPDYAALPPEVLDRTAVAYVCSPSNPQGAVAHAEYLENLIRLAEKHDFKIFADECYCEVYRDTPPPGAIEIAQRMGADPERVVIFHSLSKRSNLPGLRSGFLASGPQNMQRIKQLRAYSGAPLPLPLQRAATAVWQDEAHVEASRALYQQKFTIADEVFKDLPGYMPPQAGFFLWLPVADGEAAVKKLFAETGVKTLPGAYLSRDTAEGNPGAGYIRVALVTKNIKEMQHGLIQLRDCLY
ncbi:aminotransferase class I/II-fold pyridoxal phosphate-dependent enzyme [Alphaproteobacteria bacterium KMM 3653]|uniref:Aminotransferase class I/II-fold pyridoxal phosphate-dependent enzyme n=1 Tax=Harenicola maris TaxID=2841044 RepID=A0AAP2CNR5_9RHOB|nr:aminotransferase class I/II-fold pyridoxal phosphate-dependent enzyme [Harenicola maris]